MPKKKTAGPSFRNLQEVAKELNEFLSEEKIKVVGIKTEALHKSLKEAIKVLDPTDDEITDFTYKVLFEIGADVSGFTNESKTESADEPEPVEVDLFDEEEEEEEEENKPERADLKKTAKELNTVLKLEEPISEGLDTTELTDEIVDVCKDINDKEFPENVFSKTVHRIFKDLGVKIVWAEDSKMRIHKIAKMIPAMEKDQFEELKADILENGQQIPILIFNDEIIDGRSRYEACLAINVKPSFELWNGKKEDLLSTVISLNIKRRHLTAGQRAILAVDLLPVLEKEGRAEMSKGGGDKVSNRPGVGHSPTPAQKSERKEKSRDKAAKITGSTGKAVSTMKKIKKESPKTFKQVKEGKKTLEQAKREVIKKEPPAPEASEFEIVEKKAIKRIESFLYTIENFKKYLDESDESVEYAELLDNLITSANKFVYNFK